MSGCKHSSKRYPRYDENNDNSGPNGDGLVASLINTTLGCGKDAAHEPEQSESDVIVLRSE